MHSDGTLHTEVLLTQQATFKTVETTVLNHRESGFEHGDVLVFTGDNGDVACFTVHLKPTLVFAD